MNTPSCRRQATSSLESVEARAPTPSEPLSALASPTTASGSSSAAADGVPMMESRTNAPKERADRHVVAGERGGNMMTGGGGGACAEGLSLEIISVDMPMDAAGDEVYATGVNRGCGIIGGDIDTDKEEKLVIPEVGESDEEDKIDDEMAEDVAEEENDVALDEGEVSIEDHSSGKEPNVIGCDVEVVEMQDDDDNGNDSDDEDTEKNDEALVGVDLNDISVLKPLNDEIDSNGREADPLLHTVCPDSKYKNKDIGIFVGGLDLSAVEEDIINVFSKFGDIRSVRIIKHPVSGENKGFAFVQYTANDAARRAIAELRDGTEINGKKIEITTSEENCTLLLENVNVALSKEQVIHSLKGFGIQGVGNVFLPDALGGDVKTKGSAFVEFISHFDALAAFKRLRMPDAIFGCKESARVTFAQNVVHPVEELPMKVKSVYLEHIPVSWNKEKIKECCEKYGKISKIQLFRKGNRTKKKHCALVDFLSRDSALGCVAGLNRQSGEGVFKVSASIARQPLRRNLGRQEVQGDLRVSTGKESTEEAKKPVAENARSMDVPIKINARRRKRTKNIRKEQISHMVVNERVLPTNGHSNSKKHGRGEEGTLLEENPRKREHKNCSIRGRLSNRRNCNFSHERTAYDDLPKYTGQPTHSTVMRASLPVSGTHYQTFLHPSVVPSVQPSDLEPHAGYYLPAKQAQVAYSYDETTSTKRSGVAYPGRRDYFPRRPY